MQSHRNHFSGILDAIGWVSPSRDPKSPIRLVGFTSCVARRGVSTVASQVAIHASHGSLDRVLIVDCNFACPALHQIFGTGLSPGYSDVVQNIDQLDLSVQATQIPNLFVMAAGKVLERGLGTDRTVRRLFQILRNDYELVIFDIPSIGSQSHSITTLSLMDRVLLVLAPGDGTNNLDASYAMLECQGVNVSGIIMNQLPSEKGSDQ